MIFDNAKCLPASTISKETLLSFGSSHQRQARSPDRAIAFDSATRVPDEIVDQPEIAQEQYRRPPLSTGIAAHDRRNRGSTNRFGLERERGIGQRRLERNCAQSEPGAGLINLMDLMNLTGMGIGICKDAEIDPHGPNSSTTSVASRAEEEARP